MSYSYCGGGCEAALHSFSVESGRKVDAESGAGPLVRVGRPRMLASQKNDIVFVWKAGYAVSDWWAERAFVNLMGCVCPSRVRCDGHGERCILFREGHV
jgi:hypothetical protein